VHFADGRAGSAILNARGVGWPSTLRQRVFHRKEVGEQTANKMTSPNHTTHTPRRTAGARRDESDTGPWGDCQSTTTKRGRVRQAATKGGPDLIRFRDQEGARGALYEHQDRTEKAGVISKQKEGETDGGSATDGRLMGPQQAVEKG